MKKNLPFRIKYFCCLLLLVACYTKQGIAQNITNYSFTASAGTFTALTGATTATGTGSTVDEGHWSGTPIGFDFWYMGNRYTTVSSSTNGWLTLGANITDPANVNNLTSGTALRPVLAPLWDDLDIQNAANASYLVSGTAGSRIFTIQFLYYLWDHLATGSTISFQVKLYEGTGRIDYIYRPEGGVVNAGSASIGIAATATGAGNFLSLDGTGPSPAVSSTVETTTLNVLPAAGQTYSFAPPVPTAPTALTFTGVGSAGLTLNWADNSANESGFAIYSSTDGTTYNFVTKTSANATTSPQTGLLQNTTYYWKVYAVTEGALSSALSGTQGTSCVVPVISGTPTSSCVGANTGAITASASGGAAPYTYSLNAGAYQTSSMFTSLAAGTYTLNVQTSAGCIASTSVTVNTYATSTDDQNATATDSWVGHMYDGTNFQNYIGHFTEAESFNELFGGDYTCFSVVSNSMPSSIYTETFSVKYRMNSTRKGLYAVDLGSDDGSRLTVDGNLIYNNWTDQGFSTRPSVLINFTGASSLLYEYYENGGQNQVIYQNINLILANALSTNISQNVCLGYTGAAISGDVYGTLPAGISLSGTGYQWSYSTTVGGARTVITGATGATFSPSAAVAPFNATGTYYVYRNAVLSSTNNVSPVPYVATNESNAATIVVSPATSSTISYSGNPYCSSGGNALVTLTGISGGTYGSTAGLTINAATGTVTLGTSTPGTYTVWYFISGGGGCTGYVTTAITIATPDITEIPTSNIIANYVFNGNAIDVRGTDNGTLQNNPVATTDRFNIANAAFSFDGSSQYVTTATAFNNPGNFTESIWFKTASSAGGKLMGFGRSQVGQSSQYDRHIYMNNAGQIFFGVYPGGVVTVNSALSYNDNNWHLATATLSSTAGMVLYIDGAPVGSNPGTVSAENYTGYWRIGYDNTNGWTSQPSDFYFNGSLDDALIYSRALSAAEVAVLYASPDGAGNNGPVCAGALVSLNAITISGASYTWTGPNSFTSSLQNPTFTYLAASIGVYTLHLTVAGCVAMAYTNVVSSTSTGQWTGNVSTDWADSNNWCSGTVPTNLTSVVISSTATRMPSVLTTAVCGNLTINAGATLTTVAAGTLSIAGTLTNNGTMANSGTTVFIGLSKQQTFSGVTIFNNLTINNAVSLLLPATITVNGNLLLTTGSLNAANYNIAVIGNWTNNVSANAFIPGTGQATFNGASAQVIGGSFATTFNNFVVANTGGTVSLASAISITGKLSVNSGTFDLGAFTADRASVGGILTVANNSTLKIGGTNSYPANYSTSTLVVASTVEYSGTNQTVSNQNYGNLTVSSSGGAAVKTFPSTALTVTGNLSSMLSAGTSVSFTASSNITVNGNVLIGASTTFNGGSYLHSIGGSWANSGTFTGSTSTVTFTGSGAVISGTGAENFNNLTIAASSVTFSNAAVTLTGSLATTGSGSFSQASGGTLTMSGSGTTISGTGISLDNLTVSGTVTTAISLTLTGNLSVSGSFITSAGTIIMSGASKTLSGSGTIICAVLNITGSVTSTGNFTISYALVVGGNLSATGGTATFIGTSTLSGTANLFNATINGTSLQLSAGSILGIANVLAITAGSLDVTTSAPNTVNFNGAGPQNINSITYSTLLLTNGNTKTAVGPITTNYNANIGAATTFNASSYTVSVYGDWVNNGFFSAGTSTVAFRGPANSNIIGVTAFNILTINAANSSTEAILQSNISAAIVNMINGVISTGADTITITTTRTGNGLINGNITRTHAFTTAVAYAFEGPNNTITFSSVSGVTSITVSVLEGSINDFPFSGSISRVYNINVASGTYNATLRLHYEDDELNGNNESTMTLWHYNGSSWGSVGKSGNDVTANYVEQSGLTDITNRWTLSDNSNLVQWNGSVSTDWNTAANWTVLQGSGSRPPSAADIVYLGSIAFTNQPTITTGVTVKSIIFGSTQAVALTLGAGGGLTTLGDLNGNWTGNATHSVNVNGQALIVNGNLDLSDGTASQAINLNIGSGTVTVLGSLSETGGANISFAGAGTLSIIKDFSYVSGTFTAGTGTVVYNGTENQAIANVNYYNLTINKASGLASINAATNITGNLLTISGELDNFSTTTISGDVTINSGSTVNNLQVFHVQGNWYNNGSYISTGGSIFFDGTGSQSISASTFNNFYINKASGTATITGEIIVTGDFEITSGTFDFQTYNVTRNVAGGTTLISDGATALIGGNNGPANFSTIGIGTNSTVIYNGSSPQYISTAGVTLGNVIFRNGGSNAKLLITPAFVKGNLTIESGATLEASGYTISLSGSWYNSGTFIPDTSTLLLTGITQTVTGVTTFYNFTAPGSYTFLSNLTFNGLLNISSSGSLSASSSILTTLNGDLINSGTLYNLGTTTFTGTKVQTLSLINAVQTVALIVNFNGSFSPVLNSTSAPQFGYLNINNTGGVSPSVGWTVAYDFTVGAGATFNGGASTHNFMGNVTNNGTITSSGTLNFIPAAAAAINLGSNFTSTARVVFGGAGAITLSGTPISFNNVSITNTNSAGISPVSGWPMTNNFTINSGSIFNAGAYTHTVGGNILNNGTLNNGTSTFILNGSTTQGITSGSAFNNLTMNKPAGTGALMGNTTVNGVLNFIAGVVSTGAYSIIIPSSGSVTGAAQGTGWINGNLQKSIATGATVKNFETGDSAYYTPVNVAFGNVTTAGNLLGNTTPTEHPAIASSLINPSKSVNRYWTLTNTGVAFNNYTATFNFVASDIDAGADTAQFNVAQYNGSSWSLPTTASPRATSIKATGVTAFGDFAIGQICNYGTAISYTLSPYCTNAGTATATITGTTGGTFTSSSGLTLNAATGDVTLASSTTGTYIVTYTIAANSSCGQYITKATIVIGTAGTWTGALSTDWNTAGNWSCGGVPTAATNVTIPSGVTLYPVLTAGAALNNITIQSGASATILGGTLQIAGTVTNAGTFDATAGTIQMIGSFSSQALYAGTFLNNTILNLVISNNVVFAGQQIITGTLSFGANNKTLVPRGNLVLRSTALGTARIADITNAGANSGNAIIGAASIERYIPAHRAWRLLSAPLSASGAPTINAAWQEGSTSGNPSVGYGTQITGGTITNGFDQGINSKTSIKYYNTGIGSFASLPAGTNIPISTYPGYFLFVRGDRNTNLLQGVNAALSNTTLRMKGQVNTGNIAVNINAAGFTLVGNPYPAAIDFHTLTKSNVNDKVYFWDPKLGGTTGFGGYVTLVWNGSSYDATASASPISQYIASGEAFFTESLNGTATGTLTIKETDKNTGGSDQVFRPMGMNGQVRANLLGINSDSTTSLLDGVLTTYSDDGNNAVDRDDAQKLYNLGENIGIGRDGQVLSIERRHTIEGDDTTFLKLSGLKQQSYELQLTSTAMDSTLYAVVKDNYSAAINNTPVNLGGQTAIVFSATADPASYATDRFSIVFATLAPLPVTFTSVKAYQQQKDIVVAWQTAMELNMKQYAVEASPTGVNFTTAAVVAARVNNGGSAAYSWRDINAAAGMHYYRVRSTEAGGKQGYSAVVSVNIDKGSTEPALIVYGNSIRGNSVTAELSNVPKGRYSLALYTMAGQLVKKLMVEHDGSNATHVLTTQSYLPAAKYQLQLKGKGLSITTSIIKE